MLVSVVSSIIRTSGSLNHTHQMFAVAALQISAAMTYLHEHSIIYRDLKPQNIGFDVRGDGKKTRQNCL